jgi:hypothetical protein
VSSENKETRIESWSEIIGRLEALEIDEAQVSLMLSCRGQCLVLSFQKDDPESEALRMKLSLVKPGVRVGVLRTDTAFHVRTIKNAEDGTH